MIVSIADRHISGPDEVISAISFVHNYSRGGQDHQPSEFDLLFGVLLECRLIEWIKGVGFVDHDMVRNVLSDDLFSSSQQNPNARAELLLYGVSSSRVPPLRALGIKVSATFFFERLSSSSAIPTGHHFPRWQQ